MKKILRKRHFDNCRRFEGNTILTASTLVVGDIERVLDLKTQYLIESYSLDLCKGKNNSIKQFKEIEIVNVDANDGGSPDYHFFPLAENDSLGNRNKTPTGIFGMHMYTYEYLAKKADPYRVIFNILIKKYVKKKNLIKKINIISGIICAYPALNQNSKLDNPFLNSTIKSFEEYNLNEKIFKDFKKKLKKLCSSKNSRGGFNTGIDNIMTSPAENGVYEVYRVPIPVANKEIDGAFFLKKIK
tara:strand:+ start:205 stop:933 length:729 start_codon:yes stop_codon:yes gene_type:complete